MLHTVTVQSSLSTNEHEPVDQSEVVADTEYRIIPYTRFHSVYYGSVHGVPKIIVHDIGWYLVSLQSRVIMQQLNIYYCEM